ncbi:MAG: hypothetical protein R3C20_12435 [Planctomycetaceae bacterium]
MFLLAKYDISEFEQFSKVLGINMDVIPAVIGEARIDGMLSQRISV